MKNLIFPMLLAIGILNVCSSLAQTSDGYKIRGYVMGLKENSKIYLIDGRQRKMLDSGKVTAERFVLSGKLSEPSQAFLYVLNDGKQERLANILLDNSSVTVTGSAPVYDSIKVRGSAMDYQWKQWYLEDQQIGDKRNKLIKVHESLVRKNDSENAKEVRQVADELHQDRVSLLKVYVKRNYSNAAGALLPLVSTISGQLSIQDYQEMYGFLTPDIQNSSFGKEILNLIESKTKVEVVSSN